MKIIVVVVVVVDIPIQNSLFIHIYNNLLYEIWMHSKPYITYSYIYIMFVNLSNIFNLIVIGLLSIFRIRNLSCLPYANIVFCKENTNNDCSKFGCRTTSRHERGTSNVRR